MARKGMPGIITVGNRREWARETWGWLDWQREDEPQAKLSMGQGLGNSVVVPPSGPQSSFGLFPKPKPRGREFRGAQSRGVDKLLEELGIR
jgi:hypothetical protein